MTLKFFADLHIHSPYSIAASQKASIEEIFFYAIVKGITLLGTGDFTHPLWFREITSRLKETNGFLEPKSNFLHKENTSMVALKAKELAKKESLKIPLFVLQTELSTIYKFDGKIRKIHHIIVLPSINSAEKLSKKLARYGDLDKDGRAILKISSISLLELVLEIDYNAILIPAHIWTPWYSVLGERSGFDSIEECYGNLSKYIFAVETGLSSDPAMNRRVHLLDKYLLLSNSDAHSPNKIGRECSIFNCELTYESLYYAIKTGQGFIGTVEHFAEAGKYYLAGHRKCNFFIDFFNRVDEPLLCPICGKKLTSGVMQRIASIAARHGISGANKSDKDRPFVSTLSLIEILAQICNVSKLTSQKLEAMYFNTILEYGTEMEILTGSDLSKIGKKFPQLATALQKIAKRNFKIECGFDGKYGKVLLHPLS